MSANPWQRLHGQLSDHGPSFDDPVDELLLNDRPTISTQRADCCVARAAYRVVLAVSDVRDHHAELLLCGHHLRVSREALRDQHATIYDADNRLVPFTALE